MLERGMETWTETEAGRRRPGRKRGADTAPWGEEGGRRRGRETEGGRRETHAQTERDTQTQRDTERRREMQRRGSKACAHRGSPGEEPLTQEWTVAGLPVCKGSQLSLWSPLEESQLFPPPSRALSQRPLRPAGRTICSSPTRCPWPHQEKLPGTDCRFCRGKG